MMARFTDNARAVIRKAFRRHATSNLRGILRGLTGKQGGFAATLLSAVDLDVEALPEDCTSVGRTELVASAIELARLRGKPYVGTEDLLLALARQHEAALAAVGATDDRLEKLLSAAEDEWRRAHPPVLRRLGAWRRRSSQVAARWIRVFKR